MKKLFLIFVFIFSTNAFALITEDIVNGCDVQTRFMPVFQINSYECQSGYFLPADTLGCQPCPTGHTCSGGTFDYNPIQSQGIVYTRPITQNTTKSCSTNFGTTFVPIFEPVTVTLNYDDGLGNTTTTTCTYDGLVNIPETPPTREGYDFTGWKVAPNANNQ